MVVRRRRLRGKRVVVVVHRAHRLEGKAAAHQVEERVYRVEEKRGAVQQEAINEVCHKRTPPLSQW